MRRCAVSFVITLYVREGIVMAADSRLTLNTTNTSPDGKQVVQAAVGQTDSTNKLFIALDRIGIATYGTADIGGVPVGGFIETSIRGLDEGATVPDIANALL